MAVEEFSDHPVRVVRQAGRLRPRMPGDSQPKAASARTPVQPIITATPGDLIDSAMGFTARLRRWIRERIGIRSRAFRRLVWAAKAGEPEAQYQLGQAYLLGRGAPCYPLVAAKWLSQAAAQGHPAACHSLSLVYSYGIKAHAPAAAQAGGARRASNVIPLYAEGFDIKPDAARAFSLAKSAAQQGLAAAQGNLGLMYLQGFGCTRDYKRAARWSRFAAVQHDAGGALGLGMLHEQGLGMPVNLAEAARWYCIAADQGNDRAATALGLLLLDGRGVDRDIKQAQKLLAGPAARGDDVAKQALARSRSRSTRRFGT